jgi:hypothetical protein
MSRCWYLRGTKVFHLQGLITLTRRTALPSTESHSTTPPTARWVTFHNTTYRTQSHIPQHHLPSTDSHSTTPPTTRWVTFHNTTYRTQSHFTTPPTEHSHIPQHHLPHTESHSTTPPTAHWVTFHNTRIETAAGTFLLQQNREWDSFLKLLCRLRTYWKQ